MDSIFSRVNLPAVPVDLINTLRIFFEQGTLANKTLFEQLFVDKWMNYNLPQMDLTADAIMATYNVRFMASMIGNDAATPTRPSDGFKTFSNEIPRMGHKFPMSAKNCVRCFQLWKQAISVTQISKSLMRFIKSLWVMCVMHTLDVRIQPTIFFCRH